MSNSNTFTTLLGFLRLLITVSIAEKLTLSYSHIAKIARAFSMSVIDLITYPEVYQPTKSSYNTKVLVELDITNDEFIKMGLKYKVVKALTK